LRGVWVVRAFLGVADVLVVHGGCDHAWRDVVLACCSEDLVLVLHEARLGRARGRPRAAYAIELIRGHTPGAAGAALPRPVRLHAVVLHRVAVPRLDAAAVAGLDAAPRPARAPGPADRRRVRPAGLLDGRDARAGARTGRRAER